MALRGLLFMLYEITYTYQDQTSWTYFRTNKKDIQKAGEAHFAKFAKELGWTRHAKLLCVDAIRGPHAKPITKTVCSEPAPKPKRGTRRATPKRRPRNK